MYIDINIYQSLLMSVILFLKENFLAQACTYEHPSYIGKGS